jgi:3-hydroxybutyryl-CoA dehydrogenase
MHFLCKKQVMKVLVLSNAELKEELMVFPVHESIELKWIAEPGSATDHRGMDACIDLLFEDDKVRIDWLLNLQCPLIVINSVIPTLASLKQNFIRLNGWNSFLKRPVAEAVSNDPLLQQKATALFSAFGRRTEWVPDIKGMITPRIISTIINESFYSLEEKISSEEEIDTAMKLGTNYPYGPFEWGKKIGLSKVYALLEELSLKERRYQPCSFLKQKALA